MSMSKPVLAVVITNAGGDVDGNYAPSSMTFRSCVHITRKRTSARTSGHGWDKARSPRRKSGEGDRNQVNVRHDASGCRPRFGLAAPPSTLLMRVWSNFV